MAQAKRTAESGGKGLGGGRGPRGVPPHIAGVLAAAGVGAAGAAFNEGLWKPLLRDAETAQAAASRLPQHGGQPAAQGPLERRCGTVEAGRVVRQCLAEGKVVVVDDFLSQEELADARAELAALLEQPGRLRANPKMQAGNVETRTDRVCYIREEDESDVSPLPGAASAANAWGGGLLHCHRLLRGLALDLERGGDAAFLVPGWSQLATYTEQADFYRWHVDGLHYPAYYWLLGPVGLVLFLRWGAIRRRAYTAILYLNEGDGWPAEWGGAFRCRVAADDVVRLRAQPGGLSTTGLSAEPAGWDAAEVLPRGGRLLVFDSHALEHEVAPTFHERWALTLWLHR